MHVVVTGASSGIGEALAREFAPKASLTLVARRAEALERLAGALGTKTFLAARDLSDLEQATAWVEEAEAALGPIDVLINNAGVQHIEPTAEMDIARGERLLALNLLAPLRLIRRVLPGMLARRAGVIINIASMASLAPTAGMSYYNASKGGLSGASEAMRGELRGSGVHVLTVYPGIIKTAMADAGLVAYEASVALRLQPIGSAEVLARRVRVAAERRRARVIYPWFNHLARHFPALTRIIMDRFTPALRRG